MNNIDVLLEKWLTAFKKYGHTLDIFENPSMKEFKDIKGSFRFILDAQEKKVYAWTSMGALHSDAWIEIKKATGDTRPLYKSPNLLSGVVSNQSVHLDAAGSLHSDIRKALKAADWSFADKWVNNEKLTGALKKI